MLINFSPHKFEMGEKYLSCDEMEIVMELNRLTAVENEIAEYGRRIENAALSEP